MSDSVLVHYEARGKVALLTLDDPPANTYTHEMMRQLDESIIKARFDQSVEVIVITGAGEKFFCAGANIGMLSEADPEWKYCFCLHANETLNRLEHTPKLVIAALNGHTVGGGLEIAMAADIRMRTRSTDKISKAARSFKTGGVGRYSRSGFVHIDSGPFRTWTS